MTYALREACSHTTQPPPAQTARQIVPEALIALEFHGHSFHDPFHATSGGRLTNPQGQPLPDTPHRPGFGIIHLGCIGVGEI
jgi:nitrite reductase/ring-hydroxylating ferredoxin subunit